MKLLKKYWKLFKINQIKKNLQPYVLLKMNDSSKEDIIHIVERDKDRVLVEKVKGVENNCWLSIKMLADGVFNKEVSIVRFS